MFQAKNKHTKKQTGRKISIMFKFEYMGESYNMHASEMGRFFGVGYDHLLKSHHKGVPDQDIADLAAERGCHKPRAGIVIKQFLRKRLA